MRGAVLSIVLLFASLNISQPSPVTVATALPAGGNAIGGVTQSGTWTLQPGNTPNTTPWLINDFTGTAAGIAPTTANSKLAVTTAVNVTGAAGNLYGWSAQNGSTTTTCFLQLIDKAATPTLGTLAVFSVQLPELAATAGQPGGFVMLPKPIHFALGINVGFATTYNGSSACGTAGNVTLFYD